MADFDVVLRGGTVIDGTAAPRFAADVGIGGERIAAVGNLSGARGRCELDVRGSIVAPGFIDAHTHDDRYLMQDPLMPAKLSQGVTTVVTGNCGISLAPWCAAPGQAVPAPLDLLGDDVIPSSGTISMRFSAPRLPSMRPAWWATPLCVWP
jgi:N-acyl-D-amino-acid deacylase